MITDGKIEKESLYAKKLIDGKYQTIFIDSVIDSETGRGPGYFCLGCNRQMQAVKSTKGRKSYFRHDAIINKGLPNCSYSDETFRHQFAKEIIHSAKEILVPSITKYCGRDQISKILKPAELIKAEEVLIENFIFENEISEVEFSKQKPNYETSNIVIQPDVTFLNSEGKILLAIEMVATHKPKRETIIKYRRLGINAIQVLIPKGSPDQIKSVFSNTNKTKWIYNNLEYETDYSNLSSKDDSRIFEIDAIQRSLFEETASCRATQIREFIRTIERYLESEQFKRAREYFDSELSRVKKATDGARQELGNRKRAILDAEQNELGEEKKRFFDYQEDLERRYFSKKEELGNKIDAIQGETQSLASNIERGNTRRKDIKKLVDKQREVEKELVLRRTEVRNQFGEKEKRLEEQFEEDKRGLESDTGEEISSYENRVEQSKVEYNKYRNESEIFINDTRGKISRLESRRETLGDNFRKEERTINRFIEILRTGNSGEEIIPASYRSRRFTKKLKELGKLRKLVVTYNSYEKEGS